MAHLTLAHFPEELLERILVHALPSLPADARPLWLRSPTHPSTRLAPLLTSRQLARIGTPLLYHSVHLSTPAKARLLLRTLRADPSLAAHIRCLSLAGVWQDAAEIMSLCSPALCVLDLSIAFESDEADAARTDELYGEALKGLTGVRHVTLRKPNNVYLSLPRARAVINAVGFAIPSWPRLRTAHIAFKLSDDTPTSPVAAVPLPFSPFALPPTTDASKPPSTPGAGGPVSLLASALAAAPHLHTFTTHLPSVWNTAILAVSANPRLERIVLATPNANANAGSCHHHQHVHRTAHDQNKSAHAHAGPAPHAQGIIGTGLFLMEARRHPRLGELIKTGTPIMRTRAHTMGTPSPSPSPPPTASSAAVAVAVAPAPAVGGLRKRQSGVGLGLRIDTAGAAAAAAGSASASASAGGPVSARVGKGKGKARGKGRWN